MHSRRLRGLCSGSSLARRRSALAAGRPGPGSPPSTTCSYACPVQEGAGPLELHVWSSLCQGEEPQGQPARGEAGEGEGGAQDGEEGGRAGQAQLQQDHGLKEARVKMLAYKITQYWCNLCQIIPSPTHLKEL